MIITYLNADREEKSLEVGRTHVKLEVKSGACFYVSQDSQRPDSIRVIHDQITGAIAEVTKYGSILVSPAPALPEEPEEPKLDEVDNYYDILKDLGYEIEQELE